MATSTSGHLVEYIQTDIWVRFQKLRGNRCVYICADDTHGTAIMIRARQGRRQRRGVDRRDASGPRARLRRLRHRVRQLRQHAQRREPRAVRRDLGSRSARRAWSTSSDVDAALRSRRRARSWPTGSSRGRAPSASRPTSTATTATSAAHHYSPTELIDPRSTLSGATPEFARRRTCSSSSRSCTAFLDEWTQSRRALAAGDRQLPEGAFPRRAAARLGHLAAGAVLRLRDSRQPRQLLVRLVRRADRLHRLARSSGASATARSSTTGGRSPNCEIHHFIGKDITYFHTLFWPGMLKTAGYSLPTKVHIHGFLTVDGEKMSKSKGTFVMRARRTSSISIPAYLRYYYASKLAPRVDDLDLNLDEFVAKVNTDLVGKVVNLASRTAKFVEANGPVDDVSRRRRPVRPAAAAGDEIRRGLRSLRLQPGDAADHGARRPGESVRRRQQAVGAAQRPRASGASCKTSARSR